MKRMQLIKSIGVLLIGCLLHESVWAAEQVSTDSVAETTTSKISTGIDAATGMHYFEGSKRFTNGGPACITCHNVNNSQLIPGGVLAKDLTDVYERMGEGIKDWLVAPPFPAMNSSYQYHPLSEQERMALTAFFKHARENPNKPKESSAMIYFVVGGISGLVGILILINVLWFKRKKSMVKRDIFDRQLRAWDAKF